MFDLLLHSGDRLREGRSVEEVGNVSWFLAFVSLRDPSYPLVRWCAQYAVVPAVA